MDRIIELDDSGLIYEMNGGLIHTTQAGGTACGHPHARGTFIPFATHDDLHELLRDYWEPHWQLRENFEQLMDRFDEELSHLGALSTNRLRLNDGNCWGEAWWPVYVHASLGRLMGFTFPLPMILTWPNSD